jgi:DNA-binding transcriptional LysR family regulator
MLYITLRQLEYAVATAKAGSLSRAAQELHISQPSLSVALTQIERRLGQRLFVRRKGGPLIVTPFAERYLAEAEALLAAARRLDDPSIDGPMAGRTITLGCFQDLAPRYLAPLLARLRLALPGVDLRWRIADFETLAKDMNEGRIDLSITYDLGLDASFERTRLGPAIPYAFTAADHGIAVLESVSLARLAEEELILFEEGLSVRHMLGLFRQVGTTPRVSHRVASLEVMRSLAANRMGVGISYTVPPVELSYDGAPIAAVPIADAIAREDIILARHAALPRHGELDGVARGIVSHWNDGRPAGPTA